MLTDLIAGARARLSGGRAHPLIHPWSARRWIERHSELDADEAAHELLAQVQSFNAAPTLNSASLSALLLLDRFAAKCIRSLTESYLAGNRGASKSVLKLLESAARGIGASYELFFRASRAPRSAGGKDGLLAQVLLGMFRYQNLQNRVRLFRYNDTPPAFWQTTSNLFRHATAAGVHRLPVRAPHRDDRPATIEGEYANLLLLARLASGSFTAQEIDHASALLTECSDRLHLLQDEPAHATFALEPDSLTGLVSAHGFKVTERTLFLDPEPLFAHIKKRLDEIAADDAGDALQRRTWMTWLERLAAHWAPDRKMIPRRAERQPTDVPVALVPGLHNIHRELLAEMENAGEFWDGLIRSERWRIIEASVLDCRIQFENESADQFPVGGLIAMRKERAIDWQIGVVRRIKRFEGGRIELGVEMLAREVKAIRLWPENTRNIFGKDGAQAPDSAALAALYLPSAGAISPAPTRSLIVRISDYKSGLKVFYLSGNARVSLQLNDAIEIGRGWVWSRFTIESKSTQARDDPDLDANRELTAHLPPRQR